MNGAAIIEDGDVRQLDARATPEVQVSPDDVQDPQKLARKLQRALADLAELKREWRPRRVWFRDQVVGAGNAYEFAHGFNARVNWYVAKWDDLGSGAMVQLSQSSSTDADTLVLTSFTSGSVTLLIEEAG